MPAWQFRKHYENTIDASIHLGMISSCLGTGVVVSNIIFCIPGSSGKWCNKEMKLITFSSFDLNLLCSVLFLFVIVGTQLVVNCWFGFPGSPYERDCYLGVHLESQTTNPNQQWIIDIWSLLTSPDKNQQNLPSELVDFLPSRMSRWKLAKDW